MPADYHTHTPLCQHATGEPEAYVDAAIHAQLNEFGISDHAPALPEPFDDWRMLDAQLPAYFELIERARIHACDTLPIRAGLECDWISGCEPWIEKLSKRFPWDYLIGSVHYLESWDFDNPKWLGRWATSDVEDIWSRYWTAYTEMAESQLFDILGHPDLVKKFSFRPTGDLSRYYEPAIAAIAKSGATIELNTAGWHKPCAEAYPEKCFLALAQEAGIPLVISSDAHAPNEVARDFPQAIELARSVGYRETQLFEARRNRPVPL